MAKIQLPNKKTKQTRRAPRKGGPARRTGKRGGGGPVRASAQNGTDQSFATITRPIFPVGGVAEVHNYHDWANITSGAGSVGTYVFSTNGMYDPNITGVGHQPAGFDQMVLYYEHYYVTHASIIVRFRNVSTSIYPTVVLSVNASSTPITTVNQLLEDGSAVSSQLMIAVMAGQFVTLRAEVDIAKFGGVRNLADANEYQGNLAANPTEQSYFHISCFDQEAVGVANVNFDVYIKYKARWIEPRDVPPSLQNQWKQDMLKHLTTSVGESKRDELEVSTTCKCATNPSTGPKRVTTLR